MRQPVRHGSAAATYPCRLAECGPTPIGGEALDHRDSRVVAGQKVKAVVGEPHTETERDKGKRKASRGRQPAHRKSAPSAADDRSYSHGHEGDYDQSDNVV